MIEIIIIPLLILIGIILLAFILLFVMFAFDTFLELPFVATKKENVEAIMKLANIKEGETVVDLGSGDGRLLLAAAKYGAHAIGYELNPFLITFTLLRATISGLRKEVDVYPKDLWKADLKIADVVFVYGRKKTMQRFEDFIYKNVQKGTRIIVNSDKTIPFPTKKPVEQKNGIFFYLV